MISIPIGYRLELKPGEYLHETRAEFSIEVKLSGAQIWPLFIEPQPGCPQEVAVYFGRQWVQPKYTYGRDLSDFVPLYLGPCIQEW